MTDLSLDDLFAVAQANLERDLSDFVITAERIDANRTPAEVMRSLSDDHPDEAGLLTAAQDTLRDIVAYLEDTRLVTIPSKVPPSIVETPGYFRFGAFAAMDTPGAYETKAREAFYFVTPPEKEWTAEHKDEHLRLFNRPGMEIITIHEAYPGHYVQFLNAPHFPTRTRRLVASMSSVEGWAHYAEQMMVEEGYRDGDPLVRLAQLQEALLRDCRFIVAMKLHTAQMHVEQAARFFIENAFQEPANAREEARRGTLDPMYLCYTLGKLQIYKLRDDWRRANGNDLSRFHDAFLREGGIPIRLARRRMLGADEGTTLYDASVYKSSTNSN